MLNAKRKNLYEIEDRYEITIEIKVAEIDGDDTFKIERNELKLDPKLTNSAISIDSVYEDKSDVKISIDDVTNQETNEKTESKPKRAIKRKSQANQKQVKKTSKHTNKKDKSDNVDEIAETKSAVTPRKQKKVETKKHTKTIT